MITRHGAAALSGPGSSRLVKCKTLDWGGRGVGSGSLRTQRAADRNLLLNQGKESASLSPALSISGTHLVVSSVAEVLGPDLDTLHTQGSHWTGFTHRPLCSHQTEIQYKNPWVQIMMFKNMTPTPFLRFYLGECPVLAGPWGPSGRHLKDASSQPFFPRQQMGSEKALPSCLLPGPSVASDLDTSPPLSFLTSSDLLLTGWFLHNLLLCGVERPRPLPRPLSIRLSLFNQIRLSRGWRCCWALGSVPSTGVLWEGSGHSGVLVAGVLRGLDWRFGQPCPSPRGGGHPMSGAVLDQRSQSRALLLGGPHPSRLQRHSVPYSSWMAPELRPAQAGQGAEGWPRWPLVLSTLRGDSPVSSPVKAEQGLQGLVAPGTCRWGEQTCPALLPLLGARAPGRGPSSSGSRPWGGAPSRKRQNR
ncbi:Hypothetical predicted protein [Marmota monax]|uniref:Uncharacterized protein n=1 Tax=Marmota monax TaxID=9995 RepID=A0A5E4B4M6_MARMO|nr:Hypothetical predicted protein [Marmota monax]